MFMKNKFFFIDPQSYNNLAVYDSSLLNECAKNTEIFFFGNKLFNAHLSSKVKFISLFSYSNKPKFYKGISYILSILNLVYYIHKIKPKIVHIQWIRLWMIDYLFLKYLNHLKINTVFTAHNILPHDSGERYLKQYQKYYHTVRRIIVHTADTKKKLISQCKISPEKISIIPHGILTFGINKKIVKNRIQELREQLGVKESDVVFSSLGIQSSYKGIDILINTWCKCPLLNTNQNIKLIIAGECKGINLSEIMSIPNVRVINSRLSDVDFQCLLQLSNVVLLPYRRISQSGVLLNCIAENVPVAVSNLKGLTEPFEYGDIGWIFEANSEASLTACLTQIIDNPTLIQSKKNNFIEFETVRQHYSWKSIAQKTMELYSSL